MPNFSTRLITEAEYQRLKLIEQRALAFKTVDSDMEMPDAEWEEKHAQARSDLMAAPFKEIVV